MKTFISFINAREILDSRGNPTIEVDIPSKKSHTSISQANVNNNSIDLSMTQSSEYSVVCLTDTTIVCPSNNSYIIEIPIQKQDSNENVDGDEPP